MSAAVQISADPKEQARIERRIAAPYRGHFAWRLLFEFVRDFGGWVAVIGLCLTGVMPLWLGCLLNAWFAYLNYMPLHEATHGNVSGGARARWVNDWVGSCSAIPLWFSYRAHRVSHMKHHAYTNDPARDPDFFVGGRFRDVFPKYAILSFVQIIRPLASVIPPVRRLLPRSFRTVAKEGAGYRADEFERKTEQRFMLTCLTAFIALSFAGFFWEALLLWYLPSRLGFLLLVVVFAWLPHHPHAEQGRYRDTRITLFPMATTVIRGQNHHLLHHMFPRVPHYSLPALFADLRPILEAQGVRIEGIAEGSAPNG